MHWSPLNGINVYGVVIVAMLNEEWAFIDCQNRIANKKMFWIDV